MKASTNAIFPDSIDTATVAISTANTNRDGTGTMGTIYSASTTTQANGVVIQSVVIQATGTTTAGMVRLYRHNGSTAFLIRELAVTALTPSATVKAWTIPTSEGADSNGRLILNLFLKPGDSLRASTHNAETFNVSPDVGVF